MNYTRGKTRLWSIIALTMLLVAGLLYIHFHHAGKVALVLLCLPFSLIGGLWSIYLLDYQMSLAVVIGLIALAGMAAEFGVVMLLYLDQALADLRQQNSAPNDKEILEAIVGGALLRLRPKIMTVATLYGGLLPLMFSNDTGADVMKRIAAPLVGGMISAPIFSLIVIPSIYWLVHRTREVSLDLRVTRATRRRGEVDGHENLVGRGA
jgi:Cu(I)/Ag(I) efflux system membrane protein CusA/SilA